MPRQQRITHPQWHDPMVDMLIEERRRRNVQYHNTYNRSREEFWNSVARRFLSLCIMLFYTFKKNQISNNPYIVNLE